MTNYVSKERQLSVVPRTLRWKTKTSLGGKEIQMNKFDGKEGGPYRKSCPSTQTSLLLGVECLMSQVGSAVHTLLPWE